MKRAFILSLMILFTSCAALADSCCPPNHYDFDRDYKCSELINKIRFEKNTLYNVLNLSAEQQKLREEIEFRRQQELQEPVETLRCERQKLRNLAQTAYDTPEYKKQRSATKKAWKKVQKGLKKYDREFLKILCSTQKSKYKEIVRLTRRDIRYCYLNKKSSPKNPYLNTFGKNDAKDLCDVCEQHSRTHLFNRQCNITEQEN